MRAIVRKVLVFPRKERSELVDRVFADAVRRTACFVGKLMPPGVRIELDLDGGHGDDRALINEVELIEVVSNLAINAAHAMGGEGVLLVALSRATLADGPPALLDLVPGDYLRLAVADEGSGMDAATLSQIFQPFFTTKDVGEGTGLGLSMVYGVLHDWGARSRSRAPSAAAPSSRSTSRPSSNLNEAPTMARILLIDDMNGVRRTVRAVLVRAGHDVTEAEHGAEGLGILQGGQRFDLVITDMLMPKQDGMNIILYLEGLPRRPRTFAISGGGSQVSADEAFLLVRTKADGMLAKPFDNSELTGMVDKLLPDVP